MAKVDSTLQCTVAIRVTAVVERDYAHRGVFPSLRLAHAAKVINGATGVYQVSLDDAREILNDAEARRRNRELPKGVPAAFTAHAANVGAVSRQERRRGLVDDPGFNEVTKKMTAENPALFKVGDAAMLRDGSIVEIIEEYKLQQVWCEDGPFLDRDGERMGYKFGYTARAPGGEPFFYPAHYLYDVDGSVRHLKLVA